MGKMAFASVAFELATCLQLGKRNAHGSREKFMTRKERTILSAFFIAIASGSVVASILFSPSLEGRVRREKAVVE